MDVILIIFLVLIILFLGNMDRTLADILRELRRK